MAYDNRIKTEHNGAKNGGGYWGQRLIAKKASSRIRRQNDKKEIRQQYPSDENQMITGRIPNLTKIGEMGNQTNFQ
jgi:hypothetical protein